MDLTNGDGKPLNKPGLYRQKETGAEIYLDDKNPELGSPMIDAFVKGGWVLVGDPVPAPEVSAQAKQSKK